MKLDFSELKESDGDYPDGVSQPEITSVLENPRHRLSPIDDYPLKDFYTIACGYGSKKRILLVVSRIEDIDEIKRKILQVKVADEDEIEHYYCKG